MREQLTDAQWAAARALSEGEPQTHARIGACMDVHATTVSHKAAEQGWKSLDYRHQRLRLAQRGVVALAAALRAGEEFDPASADIDGLDEETRDAIAAAGGLLEAGRRIEAPGAEGEAELAALSDLPTGERMERIAAILTRRTEEILMRAEAGRPLESRQIAALSALVQLSERIAALEREAAAKERARSDAEIGEALRIIDDRIVYLARCETRWQLVNKFGIPQEEVDEKLPEPEEWEVQEGNGAGGE